MEQMEEGLKGEMAPLRKRLDALQKELAPYEKAIAHAEAQLGIARNDLQIFMRKVSRPA